MPSPTALCRVRAPAEPATNTADHEHSPPRTQPTTNTARQTHPAGHFWPTALGHIERSDALAYQVAVCGPSDCTVAEHEAAFRVGQLLAERGAVVICGGGNGVMAAVAAGARSRNGLVIGVRPNDNRADASPDLSATIVTNMGEARNAIIVGSADAVVVVGGSWGTLSEVALAKRRGDVRVVSLNGWQVLDQDGQPVPGIDVADSPEVATELALTDRGPPRSD